MAPARTTQTQIPDFLYHVVLITSPSESKDPNATVEQLRIFDSYTTVEKAKEAAYKTLPSLGYEPQLFSKYETNLETLEKLAPTQGIGIAVYAVAADGSILRVRILTTPNDQHLTGNANGQIPLSLYYVVQTDIQYDNDERRTPNDVNIQAVFENYSDARKFASNTLLSPQDGIYKSSYREYHEAGPKDVDCGYGENVIVHASGNAGENYLVSVIQGA